MNEQLILVLLSTVPALLVLVTPFWVMVYFDQKATREKKPALAAATELPSLKALPGGLYHKAKTA